MASPPVTRENRNPESSSDQPVAQTWLAPEQVEALRDGALDATERHPLRNEAIVALLYDLGLRRSELVGLDRGDVALDGDEATVYLRAAIQKGDARDCTLELGKWGADATRALRRYIDARDGDRAALFVGRQGRLTGRSVANVVGDAAAAAGVVPRVASGVEEPTPADVSPHTLRHSVAFRIIQREGGRLEDVQLRLRHASRATTDRVYSHLVPR